MANELRDIDIDDGEELTDAALDRPESAKACWKSISSGGDPE